MPTGCSVKTSNEGEEYDNVYSNTGAGSSGNTAAISADLADYLPCTSDYKCICGPPADCTAGANGQPCENSGNVNGTTGGCGCSCADGYSGANCQTADACTAGANGQPCEKVSCQNLAKIVGQPRQY